MEPTKILDYIYIGSKQNAKDYDTLKRIKITHILNVTPPKTIDPVAGVANFFEKNKSFKYRRCAIMDNKAQDILPFIDGCINFIEEAKFYGKVLVHCNKGISRSTAIVIAYLMKILCKTFNEAIDFVTNKRKITNPNESFREQLMKYEKTLMDERNKKRKKSNNEKTIIKKIKVNDSMDHLKSTIGPNLPFHMINKKEKKENQNNITNTFDLKIDNNTEIKTIIKKPPIGPSLPYKCEKS